MEQSGYQLPDPLITASPEWLSGEPCFTGRRVPVKALFDYVKAGHSLEEFLEAYPSVSKGHAVAVLLPGASDFERWHTREFQLIPPLWSESLASRERG